jgi:hypothetical protein
MKTKIIAILLGFWASGLLAQRGEVKTLPLADLSAFQAQAGNWRVVGEVGMDPNLEHNAAGAVTNTAGTGILLNLNTEQQKANLTTNWEHGDIELELEVMLPKGSNSGLYLQNRYEVQLFDSWGKVSPSFSDMGGIYRNWESGALAYAGKAPRVNASKAPGLWQTLKVAFQAPRFDQAGRKTANARFVYVDLNGVRIHENYEVPLPTGGAVGKEGPLGPIMFQGDHGPVAIRNFKYRLLQEKPLALTGIRYEVFNGVFNSAAQVTGKANKSGNLPKLTVDLEGLNPVFGLVYRGNVEVAEAGKYDLRLDYTGGAQLKVGGQVVAEGQGYEASSPVTLDLPKGSTPFELVYFRNTPWWPTMLGLFNFGSFPSPLHSYSSFVPNTGRVAPIYVQTESRPRLLRAFLDFQGDYSRRLTHTLAVGNPNGLHFAYDLKTANPVCVWRGEFLDATPMWHDRGDGSFRPQGAAQYLFSGVAVAKLASPSAAFPAGVDEENGFKNVGYRIDEETGLPNFLYKQDGIEIEDQLRPDATGKMWVRALAPKNGKADSGLTVRLAEAGSIKALPNGDYIIDQQYYLRPGSGQSYSLRQVNGRTELVCPLGTQPIHYSIIW